MDAHRAIENLLYRYAELIDAGNLQGVAELFRQGAILAPASDARTEGYEQVLAMYQRSTRLYENGTPCTKHVTTNCIIELQTEHRATARSYFTVFQQLPDFPLQAIISGRYQDSFVLDQGGWRFDQRQMFPELFGDLSRHLLYDAATIRR